MPNFVIERADPQTYKDNIIKFWQDSLPGTPPSRFDWMVEGNPAGPTVWFLAFTEDTHELAGIISILPKEIIFKQSLYRAGILGDFIVGKKYRAFGPAFQLIKAATDSIAELGFDLIYTIPNQKSKKMIERMGFQEIGKVNYLAKPIRIGQYLKRYVGSIPAMILGCLLEFVAYIFSLETYVFSRGHVEEVETIDVSFDTFLKTIVMQQKCIIGNYTKEYLEWRYLKNPLNIFRTVVVRNSQNELLGYLIFTIRENCLEIYDVIVNNLATANQLLRYVSRVARRGDCKSIYITVGPTSPWTNILKLNLFFDTNYDMRHYFYGDVNLAKQYWSFFAGDRNI